MLKTYSIMLGLMLCTLLSTNLQAQANFSQEDKAYQLTQVLDQILEFNEEQIEQANTVNLICVKMADEVREKYSDDIAMKDQKIQETKDHRDQRILKMLTPEQALTYRATLKDVQRFKSIPDKKADNESLEDLNIDVPKVEKMVHDLYNF